MNHQYYDYTIEVLLIENRGSFGSKPERHGPFRFCAQDRLEAMNLASSNVKAKGFPHDEKKLIVTASLPV